MNIRRKTARKQRRTQIFWKVNAPFVSRVHNEQPARGGFLAKELAYVLLDISQSLAPRNDVTTTVLGIIERDKKKKVCFVDEGQHEMQHSWTKRVRNSFNCYTLNFDEKLLEFLFVIEIGKIGLCLVLADKCWKSKTLNETLVNNRKLGFFPLIQKTI